MMAVGLTLEETRLISIICPIISIIGPLLAAPIADKLASNQQKSKVSTGRYLRIMIAIACLLSGLFYFLLTLVPIVERIELPREHRPTLRFSCDKHGATVLQERSNTFSTCYNWTSDSRVCSILLSNCNYACHQKSLKYRNKLSFSPSSTANPDQILLNDETEQVSPLEAELKQDEIEWRTKSPSEINDNNNTDGKKNVKKRRYVGSEHEPPHLCFNKNENSYCQVYTQDSGHMPVNASFRQAINARDKNEWCAYPISEDIHCRIPKSLEYSMAEFNQTCTIECDMFDPFMLPGSHQHKENQCSQIAGDPDMTFWMYLIIRSIADIFPTTAFVLIDGAVIIATRETSCGRGDVGRQLAFGSMGFAVFGPIAGYLNLIIPMSPELDYLIPIILHVVLMILTAIVALAANGMPLSPPEWWWHTCSGMLAVPMSAVKRYGSETAALILILAVLGTFWSTMDSYLPLYLTYLAGDSFTIGIVLTVGALPGILFLWKSEHFVDYCGHSNILIVAFTMYIVRFTGLSIVSDPWWALVAEGFEFFTLGIMWVTAMLYLRHLIPRQFTVTAQALPVVAHFCVGRSIGAFVGAYLRNGSNDDVETTKFVYQCMAIAAAIIASIYFVVYHGILKPRCHAQNIQHSRTTPSIVQGKFIKL